MIAAHLSTMILNWKEDNAVKIQKTIHKPLVKIVRILFIGFLTVHDFSIAIYETVVLKQESQTGYVGHLSGAIAGVLIGIFVLDNRRYAEANYANAIIAIKNDYFCFAFQN